MSPRAGASMSIWRRYRATTGRPGVCRSLKKWRNNQPKPAMIDLTTTYLGLQLKSPLVASASPLTERLENLKALEEAGAAAIVMHSLFEEQITLESQELDCHLSRGAESYSEAVTYFPEMGNYNLGPEGYIKHLRKTRETVRIP